MSKPNSLRTQLEARLRTAAQKRGAAGDARKPAEGPPTLQRGTCEPPEPPAALPPAADGPLASPAAELLGDNPSLSSVTSEETEHAAEGEPGDEGDQPSGTALAVVDPTPSAALLSLTAPSPFVETPSSFVEAPLANGEAPLAYKSGEAPRSPGERLVAAFLDGRKANTLDAYGRDLDDFARFIGAPTREAAALALIRRAPGDANALFLDYRNSLSKKGRSSATVARRMAALRSIVKLARVLGMITWSLEIDSPTVETYRDTRGPGIENVRRLLAYVDGLETIEGLRDAALLHLLFDMALRRGEAAGLDVEHVDLERRTAMVLGKKRSERAPITMPTPTCAAVASWLDVHKSGEGPLFYSLDPIHGGRRLTGAGVYFIVTKYGEKLDIELRPHGLRHAAITEALELTNGNVRAAQRLGRHAKADTTMRYDDNRRDLAGETAELIAASAQKRDQENKPPST